MTLNEYQQRAMRTCMQTCDNLSYMLINLVGEVGEFASKVAKSIRKGKARIDENQYHYGIRLSADEIAEHRAALKAELGDCLWQLSGLCSAMGWTLEEIAQENLEKLASRAQRGVIDGNGDNR